MTMIVLGEVATGMGVARNLEDSGANLNQVRHITMGLARKILKVYSKFY